MRVEVRRLAERTPEEREELRALGEAVYPPGTAADEAGRHIHWASSEWGVVARDDAGAAVGFVGILRRDITVDGRVVPVGGIGGVKTHPQVRGQGYGGAAMRRAATFMAEELGAAFGLLVCREALVGYYGQFGWLPFDGTFLVEQGGATVPFTFNRPLLLPLNVPVPQGGTIDLCGLPW